MSIEPLPRSDGLLIQRSRQYTYCAVVSIPAGTEVKKRGSTVRIFSLEEQYEIPFSRGQQCTRVFVQIPASTLSSSVQQVLGCSRTKLL